MAPLGGQHYEVQGVGGLHLEPAPAAAARLVGGAGGLGHDALVTASQGSLEKVAGLAGVGGHDARYESRVRDELGQGGEPA